MKLHEIEKIGLLAWRLKNLRESKGVTLRQVEAETGLSNAYLSKLENGRNLSPSIWVVKRLGEYYQASLDYLTAPIAEEGDYEDNFAYMIEKEAAK